MNPFTFAQVLRNLIAQSIDCCPNICRRQGRTGMDFLGQLLRSYRPIVNNLRIILFRLLAECMWRLVKFEFNSHIELSF